MRTLLLNGCSFGKCWTPSQNFVEKLGCDTVVNLSKVATSFQRTYRSTIEWIAQNGKPSFIIIPITFYHRWELGIAKNDDPIDGVWFPLKMANVLPDDLNTLDRKIDPSVNHGKLKKLLELYYGTIPDIRPYCDKMFSEIITLSAFLHQQNIPHLMFDMCNNFDRALVDKWTAFEKVKYIHHNKNIIDLFKFCGNKEMWNSQNNKENNNFNIHHKPEQYLVLEAYLEQYMKQNSIIQ